MATINTNKVKEEEKMIKHILINEEKGIIKI